jgi:glycerol-3-phosphate dehydrogenase
MDTNSFSSLSREQYIKELKSNTYDLLVIGGGVTGCGIALDAASRGLKVALVEKEDFASGTSSKSTKLIHGGLRYLKQFDVGLVRETGQERAVLNKLARHLALPEKMLLPIIEDGTFGKMSASIGLWVYDFLAGVKGEDKRKMLSKEEALKEEPLLNAQILKAAGYYAEYRTDDARLTIELIKKAVSFGAIAMNYLEVVDFLGEERIEGVSVKDIFSGHTYEISALKVVSATGPWVDTLRTLNNSLQGKRLHLTKGVHIVVPREKLPLHNSIYFDVPDGRMIFAIPRGRATYIGTTDTNYTGDLNHVVSTESDRDYLLGAVNNAFPDVNLEANDVESNWAGLRPLIHEEGKSPSELSRKDEIFEAPNGLVSIAGGKLTGYRKMAEKVVDLVIRQLMSEKNLSFPSTATESIYLVDDPFQSNSEVSEYISQLSKDIKSAGLEENLAWYLVTNYGKAGRNIFEGVLAKKEVNMKQLILAELQFGIENELVNTLEDFFVRRTGRLYFNIKSVLEHKELVQNEMSNVLNWSKERKEKEEQNLNELIEDATKFYAEDFPKG